MYLDAMWLTDEMKGRVAWQSWCSQSGDCSSLLIITVHHSVHSAHLELSLAAGEWRHDCVQHQRVTPATVVTMSRSVTH